MKTNDSRAILLDAKRISYAFNPGTWALRDVDFNVCRGEIVGVFGPNGAGKTTLFLALNGVLFPQSGELFFEGRRMTRARSDLNALRQRMGIVFQDPNDQLFCPTVEEDVAFGVENLGLSDDVVQKRVALAAQQTGIVPLLKRPIHALSFGQKKRVAIAGVLAMNPDIIVMDEPTAGLDPQGICEMFTLMCSLRESMGLAVVFSTHEVDWVPLYCDVVHVLDKGRSVLRGTPIEVFRQKKILRAIGLRTPRMAHLVEVLNDKDRFALNRDASTISAVRKALKEVLPGGTMGKSSSSEEAFEVVAGKRMRKGYTTGACATASAVAAAQLLLTGGIGKNVTIYLEKGEVVIFQLHGATLRGDTAICSVIKDAGDDPDVTHGLEIVASCELKGEHRGRVVEIVGGEGVGVVTRRGLKRAVGEHAINPAPLAMIERNILMALSAHEDWGVLRVTLSIPGGAAVAEKTFNPILGIVGGLSILGTTGVVEPMSQKALVDSIKLSIDQRKAEDSREIVLCPGNYGATFAQSKEIPVEKIVKCSNFIGETLDYVQYSHFQRVVIVAHFGKLVKVAGGVMDTHSRVADCRMEILCAHSALEGVSKEVCQKIMGCVTTEEALLILKDLQVSENVIERVIDRAFYHIVRRVGADRSITLWVFGEGWEAHRNHEG